MRIILDGKKMLEKDQTHKYIRTKFNFPKYYGNNLDALWDMLTTIHKKVDVQFINVDFYKKNSSYKEKLIDLFSEASKVNEFLNVEFVNEAVLSKEENIMKFNWVTIMVNDMKESISFYNEILGLPVKRRFKSGKDSEICFLGDGETQVELIHSQGMNESKHTLDISLGFVVDSLEEAIGMLVEQGIEIFQGPFSPNDHIKYLFILDPNGVKIQLAEMS